MNQEFKYKVGDLLTTTAIRKGMVPCGHRVDVLVILTVILMKADECSAGSQPSYLCRVTNVGYQASMLTKYLDFHECELTADLSSVEPEKTDN